MHFRPGLSQALAHLDLCVIPWGPEAWRDCLPLSVPVPPHGGGASGKQALLAWLDLVLFSIYSFIYLENIY